MTHQFQKDLTTIVGNAHVLSTSPEQRITYGSDNSRYKGTPDRVVLPGSAKEVAAVLGLCHTAAVPVFTRGAGTGTTGGAIPTGPGLVLDLSRLNRILGLDPVRRVAVVEPMVINDDLRQAARPYGLTYPPDPASLTTSSLGGNVAENAGGLHCVKYGVTRDFVLGLEIVTADGDIVRTGYFGPSGDSMIDLTPLLVSSEGTLAVMTRLALRLSPIIPFRAVVQVQFASLSQATRTVSAIIRAGLVPSTLEFMDAATLDAIYAHMGGQRSPDVNAVLLIEVDGEYEAAVARQLERVQMICREHGAIAIEPAHTAAEQERLWELRRNVSPALKAIAPTKINEDVVVPRSRIPDLVERVTAIAAHFQLKIVCFGHAGDGNVHVNIMTDDRDTAEFARAEQAVDAVFQATLELGGVISGEHGIGLAKKEWFPRQQPPSVVGLHRRLKRAFDPDNVMNPGKIFDAE